MTMQSLRPLCLMAVALCFVRSGLASAQLAVTDVGNTYQNTISAVESLNQTAQLLKSYQNQLAQYERMLTDGVVPLVYVWDQITEAVDAVRKAEESMRNGRGALTQLNRFIDPNYYRGSKCYNSTGAKGGCFQGYRELMDALQQREAEAQEERDKMLVAQLESLSKRADKGKRLQQNASAAKGQLEAIQHTNQLLDAQAAELRDLRALLITQQRVAAEETRKRLVAEAAARELSEKWHAGDQNKPRKPGKW